MLVKKNSDNYNDGEQPCKYHLSRDSNKVTMIVQCIECQGEAGLDNQRCMTGILQGLYQEFNVDSVILSHYIETKYAEDSMKILRMMVDVLLNLDHMSLRKPYDEYFANHEVITRVSSRHSPE